MHTLDVLYYGNRTYELTVANIPKSQWTTPDVCGIWAVKDIIAHLASHEWVLVDVLKSFLGSDDTPVLNRFKLGTAAFNDPEVEKRSHLSGDEVISEYRQAHQRTMELIKQLPPEKMAETGALPWYGSEYDLQDYIAYGFYGHKREHSAQINVFRDELVKKGILPVPG